MVPARQVVVYWGIGLGSLRDFVHDNKLLSWENMNFQEWPGLWKNKAYYYWNSIKKCLLNFYYCFETVKTARYLKKIGTLLSSYVYLANL